MIVTVSMKSDEDKFLVHEWWARDSKFVIATLQDQLTAAKAIWPVELKDVEVCVRIPNVPETNPTD